MLTLIRNLRPSMDMIFRLKMELKHGKQWQDIGAFFTGWDWNEDGKTDTDYGLASMDKRGDTLWWGFNSRATAYGKHPDDPGFILDTKTEKLASITQLLSGL